MKATITILAAIFTLQAGILFAGNDNTPEPSVNIVRLLAPVVPAVATFEETAPVEMYFFMPVVPTEATFEDIGPVSPTIDLSPVTPEVADFEDTIPVDENFLAPVMPARADFE